jgi:hypothetical protein
VRRGEINQNLISARHGLYLFSDREFSGRRPAE